MKTTLKSLVAIGALGLGACGSQAQKPGSAQSGQLHISAKPQVSTAANENTDPDSVCATFTLTPYAPSSDGSTVMQAGAPVTFTTSDTSTATDQILGCISGSTDYNFPESDGGTQSANWGYLVSATNFTYCADGGTIDPSTIDPAPTFYAAVNCVAGQDETLTIDYPVSFSSADPGGYIDISAGVDASEVFVGCKTPDVVAGALHFGEANTIDGDNDIPIGLVGYTVDGQGSDTSLSQYGSQVSATDPADNTQTLYDTSYTGQFTSTAGWPSTILQTFLTDATGTQAFDPSTCTTEWADTRHALCLTNTAKLAAGAQLADAFLFVPGAGYAAASVSSDLQTINISAQMLPNSGSDYSSAAFTATMTASFSSSDAAPSSQAGFNDALVLTPVLVSSASPAMTAFTGVFIDPVNFGEFIVGATDGTNNYWAELQPDGAGGWTLGNFSDISTAPYGFGVSESGCLPAAVPVNPPTIDKIIPANGQTGVANSTTQIIVNFSEQMDPSTVTASSFYVTPAGGAALSGTVSMDSTDEWATLTLSSSLPLPSTLYTVTITTAVASQAVGSTPSVHLVGNFTSIFTTGP